MVREIIWSVKADRDRFKIFKYWDNRNKSQTYRNKSQAYSFKLNQSLLKSAELVADMPELGIATNVPSTRFTIILDYSMYYRITPTRIEIITIWDHRRNPKKLTF